MAEVSINTDAMGALISAGKRALYDIPNDVGSLEYSLEQVGLSCGALDEWSVGGWRYERLAWIVSDFEARQALAYETMAAATRLGGNTVSVTHQVRIDDAVLHPLEDARHAADMINAYLTGSTMGESGAIPPELTSMLDRYAGDPRFAMELAQQVPPDVLAAFLAAVNRSREVVSDGVSIGASTQEDVDRFDAGFDQLLNGLGDIYSTAASSMGADGLERFTTEWVTAMQAPGSVEPLLLSMVVGRGSWPRPFLTGVADAVQQIAGDQGALAWGLPAGTTVTDPGLSPDVDGGHQVVSDPMAGVYQSSATFDPGWMVEYFTGHDRSSLDLPGYDYPGAGLHADAASVDVDSRWSDTVLNYGFDDTSAYWWGVAMGNATLFATQYDPNPQFVVDAAAVGEYFSRQSTIWDNTSWWDKNKHSILQGVSMALAGATFFMGGMPGWVVAALSAADTVLGVADVALYFQDGQVADGLLAAGSILLPIGIGGLLKSGMKAVRWVRITRKQAAALKRGESVLVDGTTVTPQMAREGAEAVRGIDPVHSSVDSGSGWVRTDTTGPDDPLYGKPRSDSGVSTDIDSVSANPALGDKITDPGARYGRDDEDGHALSKQEYDAAYTLRNGGIRWPPMVEPYQALKSPTLILTRSCNTMVERWTASDTKVGTTWQSK